MTPFQSFVARWRDCTACGLCDTRKRVVLCRGTVPADVLFVGEAPGRNENITGLPFVGNAGCLLDDVIRRSLPAGVSYALTNLVCCLPPEDEDHKIAVPDDDSVRACAPRLREFVDLCRPRLIVCVGNPARDWLDRSAHHNVWREDVPTPDGKFRLLRDRKVHWGADIPRIHVEHPASILRYTVAQQSLAVQRVVVTIANAVAKLEESHASAQRR